MENEPKDRIERQNSTPRILLCPEGRRPVHLVGEVLARGGEGSIQALAGEPPLVAKLYHAPSPERRAKVEAMLADPPRLAPLQRGKRQYLQLTWPVGVLEDLHGTFFGYAMPRLALERTVTLEALLTARARRAYGLPEDYRFRLKVAYQLAHLVAELHAHGHHIIDLKPQNLHVYRDAPYLALLDTDGFSIHGENRRYPAHVFSDGYIAPEALRQALEPEQLDEAQDRFALAVILFQLLNHGLHPYQGVPAEGSELPNTNGERIKAGLYAYGRQSHPDIAPAPVSLHRHFDDPTRALFDRAFLPDAERPDAAAWAEHLAQLLDPAHSPLVPCPERPNDSHFKGACELCAAAERAASAAGNAADQTKNPRHKRREGKQDERRQRPAGNAKQANSNRLLFRVDPLSGTHTRLQLGARRTLRSGDGNYTYRTIAGSQEEQAVLITTNMPDQKRREVIARVQSMITASPGRTSITSGDGQTHFPLYAWPHALIVDETGEVKGFLQPYIFGRHGYRTLRRKLDRTHRDRARRSPKLEREQGIHLALELCHRIRDLHNHGHHAVSLSTDKVLSRDFNDQSETFINPYICLTGCLDYSINSQQGYHQPATESPPIGYAHPLFRVQGPHSHQKERLQDQYTLAVIIHELLCGRHPFDGQPHPGPGTVAITNWSDQHALANFFRRAFNRVDPPSVTEWLVLLHAFRHGHSPAYSGAVTGPNWRARLWGRVRSVIRRLRKLLIEDGWLFPLVLFMIAMISAILLLVLDILDYWFG